MAKQLDGVLFPKSCAAFEGMDDEAFEQQRQEAIQRLEKCTDLKTAQDLYKETTFPMEMERVRRSAVHRLADGEAPLELLFVTVGGQKETPSLATMASPAHHVVFLHTDTVKHVAIEVVGLLDLGAAEASLHSIGDGKDVLVLYRAVFELWEKHGKPETVGMDLTGGYKTMSAAAAAAAFSLPRGRVFYVDHRQPLIAERPFWVDEERLEIDNPFTVFGELQRASARFLLRDHRYPAAQVAFEELRLRMDDGTTDDLRARLAEAYTRIEALDFENAELVLAGLLERLEAVQPTRRDDAVVTRAGKIRENLLGVRALLALLDLAPKKVDDPAQAVDCLRDDRFFDFVAMLLCSAERRRGENAFDVAALLAYRAMEAVVQRRLCLCGNVDPSNPDPAQLAKEAGIQIADIVSRYNAETRKRQHHITEDDLRKPIARVQAFTLLKVLFPDDIADALKIQEFAGIGESRNRSLLAHGFQKLEPGTVDKLIQTAKQLFECMLEVEGKTEEHESLLMRHRFVDITE